MSDKELVVVAGPNGVGKTTFAKQYLQTRPLPFLSADQIAEALAPDDPTSARVAAGREFLRRLDERLSGIESILVESTLSGRGFLRTLRQQRRWGLKRPVILLFLESPDVCVARIAERVRKCGHDVPEADVRRRFRRSLSNFQQRYRQIADHWVLTYNSESDFQGVAVGRADDYTVRHEQLFARFLRLVEDNENV